MEVVITQGPADAAVVAADAIERLLQSTPQPVLGLSTGSSPLPTYRELIDRHERGAISFAEVRAFLLDEYVGLDPSHPEAYRSFIEREFTSHIDLPPSALFGPDGNSVDPQAAPQIYEQQIDEAGGVDLQLLGIGTDGHIGFNEPTSSLGSRTRMKTLTDATRVDNARFFQNDVEAVPRHVLTQGIGTILQARHVILVATGELKAAPIAQAVEGPLTAMVPASALQLHPHATIVIDEPAAKHLTLAPYYRAAYDNKPDWQHI
ncbi:MAG: glucosamine-6-phosphate deaminase [Acidimicrobiales bacterium]